MFTVAAPRPLRREVAGYTVSAVQIDDYSEVALIDDRGGIEIVWQGRWHDRSAAFLAICEMLARGGQPLDYVWRWNGTGMVAVRP